MTDALAICWSEIEDWSEIKAEVLRIATADPRNTKRRDEIAEELGAEWEGAREAVFGIYAGALAKIETDAAKPAWQIKRRKFTDAAEPEPKKYKRYAELKPAEASAKAKADPLFWAEPQPNVELNEEAKAAQPKPEPAKPEPIKAGLPAVVPQPKPPVPADLDEAVAAMNERHAIIENMGGKTVIACSEPSPIDLKRKQVVFQTKGDILLRYANRAVPREVRDAQGGIRIHRIPLGQWWLGSRDRRQHPGVTFLPGGEAVVDDCLNLWQGWGVEPKAGDWGLIRGHIEEVVAGGNAEFAEYVVRWIAWAIQNPAAQAEVALVLIGEKGVGKGTLVRCLERIFGAHAFQVSSREHVIDKFNGHLQDCVLFVADEAYWGGDKRCVGRLQGMITEPTLSIERKGIDVIQVRNFLHVLMLAEPGWVIPAGRFERRYAAFAVSTARRGDREYFRALHHQIGNGGAEAMMWDLQGMALDGWHPREIPEGLLRNAALQEQQSLTLPPWEQWYLSLLHNGKLPGAIEKRPNTSLTIRLLADARERIPRLRWESEIALRDFLVDKKRLGIACDKYRAAYANGWGFPPLAECREAWQRMY